MYFEAFLKALKRNPLPSVFTLCGPADDVRLEALRLLRETWRERGGRIQVREASKASEVLQALEALGELSLFSGESKLLVLRVSGKAFSGDAGEFAKALERCAKNASGADAVAFWAPNLKKGTKFYKHLEAAGWVIEAYPLYPEKAAAWLKQESDRRGLRFPEVYLQRLLERLGGDLSVLRGALDLLELYVYPGREVDEAALEAVSFGASASDRWQMLDAFLEGRRDVWRCWRRLPDGEEGGFLSALLQRLRELRLLKALQDGGEVQRKLGWHPFRLKQMQGQAARFDAERLRKIHALVLEWQFAVLAGRLSPAAVKILIEQSFLPYSVFPPGLFPAARAASA